MNNQRILRFLSALKKNNNKAWMDANRSTYETAKLDFQDFVQQLIEQVAAFDETVAHLQPKDCIFRINRDIRFSKDKSPYKSNMGAYICKVGKKGNGAGYYIHLEPGKSFMAGGIWMPEKNLLDKIRQEIDYGWDEWQQITRSKKLLKYFPNGIDETEKGARPPKGYDADNPAIEAIKLKSFVCIRQIPDTDIIQPQYIKDILKGYKELQPIVNFINRSLEI